MGRFSNTWSLMKSSFNVLREDKKLLLFPLFSGIFTLIVLLSFFLPLAAADTFYSSQWIESLPNAVLFILIFLFYLFNYFVILFFNSAAVAYAIDHMRGGNPTLKGAFLKVQSRLGPLLGWTIIAATIGLVLNTIENQSDAIGKILIALLGLSWTVISFLVLPILIIENKGPIDALKESAAMLKKTWAEQLIGHFSFGLIFALLIIPFVLIALPLMFMGGVFSLIGTLFIALCAISLGILQWVLQSIFMGTVYLYVREQYVPSCFSLSQIDKAMR